MIGRIIKKDRISGAVYKSIKLPDKDNECPVINI